MPAHGSRRSLAAGALFAVASLAGAVIVVVHLPGHAAESADATAAGHPTPTSGSPRPLATMPHQAARPTAGPTATPARGHRPRRAANRMPHAPATTAMRTPPRSAPARPGGHTSPAAQQVLALINQARAQAGLASYTVSSGLDISAARHNSVMASGCGLSHQCPGEPPLGDRETAAGASWTAAGENVGEGGPVADTPAAIAQMAARLTQSMLNEKPPGDGHRLNILSSTFTHIGIAVVRDRSGTVWLTQDFSN
jgi:uncharacterized protein YkwD